MNGNRDQIVKVRAERQMPGTLRSGPLEEGWIVVALWIDNSLVLSKRIVQ